MGALIGLLVTAWSAIRSSKLALYVVMAAGAALFLWLFIRSREKAAVAEAMRRSVEAAYQRMERSREVHREIQRLPLGERARRLRELDARR